jgi:hypothetical protein
VAVGVANRLHAGQAETSISSVDLGRWKLVISASTMRKA